ncbi:zinc finger MYM-type protein 1-like [Centruroides vittatus]|uniref:zinc finger MYM-type protein 1-like n=1 Tax=Centruroides vittatus TaxID=120091 RepID=UPI00350F1F43
MSNPLKRERDVERKYKSGCLKRKLSAKRKIESEKLRGALNKFLKIVNDDKGEEGVKNKQETQLHRPEPEEANIGMKMEKLNITDDPASWPGIITQQIKDYLVKKNPTKIILNEFPRQEDGTHFSKVHLKRKPTNGEIISRPWIIYSESEDRIICFYCRLFSMGAAIALAIVGFNNWPNIYNRLATHEKSKNHLVAMLKCTGLQKRLSAEQTINNVQQKLLNQEKVRLYNKFERLFSVVQFLAERNIAFRGSIENLSDARNGIFLGILELLGKFDPVMQDHIQRIATKQIHQSYLSKTVQNEIINLIGNKLKYKIIDRIKYGKYFAVILDCTPDISHQEKMSLSIRYVSDGTLPGSNIAIYEQFIKFIHVESSTGENLFFVLKKEIQSLGLDINNIRGQGYDNGSNMKGKVSGVQARLLKENPRAFFTPCVCHNYNLVSGDVAKICLEALTFFGILRRLYVLFSAFLKRWLILLKYIKELTAKPLCDTRWECRIQSVKAVRYQIGEFYDALFEISEITEDPQIKSEAESLGNAMKDYKFLELQSKSVDVSIALSSFEKLLKWLSDYRNTEFEQVFVQAKTLAEDLEISTEFEIKDKATESLKYRFGQLKNHNDLFEYLGKFQNMKKEALEKHAAKLEISLTDSRFTENDAPIVKEADIDGKMLVEEMEALKSILPSEFFENPFKMFKFLSENDRATAFPNLFIALRIYLTIPVSVASGQRSFSRLKLVKNYLRSTMTQDRLNSLAIMSIESDEARKLDFQTILEEFTEQQLRNR